MSFGVVNARALRRCACWTGLAFSAAPVSAIGQIRDESGLPALTARAREQPDSVREAFSRELSETTSARSASARSAHMAQARKYADAYLRAWNDSFFVRQAARFESASPARRVERLLADSLRRQGNAVIGKEGVPAAMKFWRESLNHARSVGDPATIAPALLAVGAGFYRLSEFDSATTYLKQAERLAVQVRDNRTTGNVVGILASIAKDQGDLTTASSLYRRAVGVRARSGDSRGIAADENNIGLIAQERGDFRQATDAFALALELNRRGNRPSLVALNLSNLATIATVRADYSSAESLYQEALALYHKTGDRAETAYVLHGLSKLQISRGDYREAAAALLEALRIHDSSGAVMDGIAVRIDLAAVENATGHPESARLLLQKAGYSADAEKAPPEVRASLALARGDLAVQFGTFAEADEDYSQAVRLYRIANDSSGLARSLEGKALLLHWRGDDGASLELLREAVRLLNATGDRRLAALTNVNVADVEMSRGDTAASRVTLTTARSTLRTIGDAVGEASALAALGDLAQLRGSYASADAIYHRGLKRLGSREASELRWRLNTGLAYSLRKGGMPAATAAQFRIAIAAMEHVAASVRTEERRSGFLADKWSAYEGLALVEQARGRPGEAFAASEQMRARQMLDLLARGRVGSATAPTRDEQDLRRRIETLTAQLETGQLSEPRLRGPPLTSRAAESTRSDLDAAQKKYARLLLRLRETDPAYAAMVSASARSWKDVAARLKPNQIFLEYMLTDSACTAFVVTSDTVAAIDLHVTRQTLADLVEFSRKTIDSPRNLTAKALWRVPLRRLYATLIQPVADRGYLNGKSTLLIAPHGELHFLSFAALILPGSSDHFLVEQFQIGYAPSATVWLHLAERRFRAPPAAVLALAPDVKRLPGSRLEADAIGRIYGKRALVRMGNAATPAALRAGLAAAGVVHLATFGVLNKHNPLFSFIELAPSARDDGRLEVNEVFGLTLSGQLVILSACQTALGAGALADIPPGDDWVGLVQAFLQAGARSIVASLWPVQDRATGALMEKFHEQLAAGVAPVTALAAAQRALIRNHSTSEPVYWAGFTINGLSE